MKFLEQTRAGKVLPADGDVAYKIERTWLSAPIGHLLPFTQACLLG
jgi:hypothetical protein